jgi:hypothetical protein
VACLFDIDTGELLRSEVRVWDEVCIHTHTHTRNDILKSTR